MITLLSLPFHIVAVALDIEPIQFCPTGVVIFALVRSANHWLIFFSAISILVWTILHIIIIAILLEVETVQFGKALVVVLAILGSANHGAIFFRASTGLVRTTIRGHHHVVVVCGTRNRDKRSKEASEVQEFHLEGMRFANWLSRASESRTMPRTRLFVRGQRTFPW
jgi:hypothetical protein